jgi:hypothetical protein
VLEDFRDGERLGDDGGGGGRGGRAVRVARVRVSRGRLLLVRLAAGGLLQRREQTLQLNRVERVAAVLVIDLHDVLQRRFLLVVPLVGVVVVRVLGGADGGEERHGEEEHEEEHRPQRRAPGGGGAATTRHLCVWDFWFSLFFGMFFFWFRNCFCACGGGDTDGSGSRDGRSEEEEDTRGSVLLVSEKLACICVRRAGCEVMQRDSNARVFVVVFVFCGGAELRRSVCGL